MGWTVTARRRWNYHECRANYPKNVMSKSAKSAFKYSFGLDFNGFHHLIGISLTIRMGMDQNLCTIVGRDEAHKSSSQIIIGSSQIFIESSKNHHRIIVNHHKSHLFQDCCGWTAGNSMGFATEADAGTWPLRSSTTQGQVGRGPRAEMAENHW